MMREVSFDPTTLVRDYGDPAGEAKACRADCAIFDFSFMARARLRGPRAIDLLRLVTPRDLSDQVPGAIRYALRIDAEGRVVADLTVWRTGVDEFEVYSGRGRDIEDLVAASSALAEVADLGADTAVIAVQGPRSRDVVSALGASDAISVLGYFRHAEAVIAGVPCRIGRLGYTGERGYELVTTAEAKPVLWSALTSRARAAGFAAADILRIEAGFILFANELSVPVTAAELGLARFACAGAWPIGHRLVSFMAQARQAPVLFRPAIGMHFPPAPGQIAVTSACISPVAGGILGLGFVAADHGNISGTLLDPEAGFSGIREVPLPFVDFEKRRPRH